MNSSRDISKWKKTMCKNLIYEKMGLNESLLDWRTFLNTLQEDTKRSFSESIEWFIDSAWSIEHEDIVSQCFLPPESYFFRNKALHELLEENSIQELMQRENYLPSRIKIWSAGCSTGEEVYSLLIHLEELYPENQYEMYATDINEISLEKARRGAYRLWSFRNKKFQPTEKYFIKKEGIFHLHKEVIDKVNFFHHNLVNDPIPSELWDVDLIICQNVMIYFSCEIISQVIKKFYSSLKDKGILITSPFELFEINKNKTFTSVYRKGLSYFIKNECQEKVFEKQEKKREKKGSHKVRISDLSFPEKRKSEQFSNESKLSIDKVNLMLSRTGKERGKIINEVLERFPLFYYAYFVKGVYLKDLGDIESSIDFFNKSLYLNPYCLLGFFMLGLCYKKVGNEYEFHRILKHLLYLTSKRCLEENLLEEDITVGELKDHIKHILQEDR